MVNEARVREAAEDLVRVRYGETSPPKATTAGEDMRDWQLGSDRVSRAAKAGRKAAKKVAKMSNMENPPSLEGSEKQVNWANEIRSVVIRKTKTAGNQRDLEGLEKLLAKKIKASYWIENRFNKTAQWQEEFRFVK